MEEDFEMMVYQMMCKGCPNAKRCHDACENCEEYEEEIRRLTEEN